MVTVFVGVTQDKIQIEIQTRKLIKFRMINHFH